MAGSIFSRFPARSGRAAASVTGREHRVDREVDRSSDSGNVAADRSYLHPQDRGLGKLGGTSGGTAGVFGYPNCRQWSVEHDRGGWIAVDQQRLGSSGQ
jgi:hypothetical protein